MIGVTAVRHVSETQISWAEDQHPELHRYLRESAVLVPFRRRRPAASRVPGSLVAWAELDDSAPAESPGRFRRRVWWLAEHDPYPGGGSPVEAVDPCSIRRGHESLPARAA